MESSLAKIVLVTLLLVGALMATASGSHDDEVPFTDCGKDKHYGSLPHYRRNLDLVLYEMKTEPPVDGNFEHETESKSDPKVFGRASCFSSLTTNVDGCTSCLDKAIRAIKSECKNSTRASAGTAAAGCSIRYDNVKFF